MARTWITQSSLAALARVLCATGVRTEQAIPDKPRAAAKNRFAPDFPKLVDSQWPDYVTGLLGGLLGGLVARRRRGAA